MAVGLSQVSIMGNKGPLRDTRPAQLPHKESGTRLRSQPLVLTHRFPTEVHRVGELVDILLEARELDPKDAQELGLALRELLLNAMEHGNLEITFEAKSNALQQGSWKRILAERSTSLPYRSRETHVTAHWTPDCVAFTIADQGKGFDWRALPDPTDPDNLLLDNGRGVLLARLSVDSLTYNEAGNVVTILKRLR